MNNNDVTQALDYYFLFSLIYFKERLTVLILKFKSMISNIHDFLSEEKACERGDICIS